MFKSLKLFIIICSPYAIEQFYNLISVKRNIHFYKDFRLIYKGLA